MAALKTWGRLLRETVAEWSDDKVPRLGAALAYYTVFSLAPLLIIAIVVVGAVIGQNNAQDRIVAQIAGLVGMDGAIAVNRMIDSAKLPANAGAVATGVGVTTLVIGALGAFAQLQDAFDTIWEVTPKKGGGALRLVKTRLMAFAMVLVVSFLLLVSLAVNALLAAGGSYLQERWPQYALIVTAVNWVLPLLVSLTLFAVMFKVLPDVELRWRDVLPGAALTAALFILGKFVIGFYLGHGRLGTAYGAAGSVLIILVWIYYSAQILFFGAEFTQVYVRTFRPKPPVADYAVAVSEAARENQGVPHVETIPATRAPKRRYPWLRRTKSFVTYSGGKQHG
jgi:membrane protein